MTFVYFVTVTMQRSLSWIHSVWKSYFRSVPKWNRTGYQHYMFVFHPAKHHTISMSRICGAPTNKLCNLFLPHLFLFRRFCDHRSAKMMWCWLSPQPARSKCGHWSATRTSTPIPSMRTNRSKSVAWMRSRWIVARKINGPYWLCAPNTGKSMMRAISRCCVVWYRHPANDGWAVIFLHTIASFCGRMRAKGICIDYRQSEYFRCNVARNLYIHIYVVQPFIIFIFISTSVPSMKMISILFIKCILTSYAIYPLHSVFN